jgi:hypothetical protein
MVLLHCTHVDAALASVRKPASICIEPQQCAAPALPLRQGAQLLKLRASICIPEYVLELMMFVGTGPCKELPQSAEYLFCFPTLDQFETCTADMCRGARTRRFDG